MNTNRETALLCRINALVDSVFAIVMTILVLDIKAPRAMDGYKNLSMQNFLTGYYEDILLYMVAFIALGYLWYIHYEISRHIKRTDRIHLMINIVTLMFVALVPFSSSLVNRFTNDWLAEVFLATNMLLIGVCNYFNWAYASDKRRLLEENVPDSVITAKQIGLSIPIMGAITAIIISFVYPVLASYALLLAPILVFFKDRTRKR